MQRDFISQLFLTRIQYLICFVLFFMQPQPLLVAFLPFQQYSPLLRDVTDVKRKCFPFQQKRLQPFVLLRHSVRLGPFG